MYKGQNPVKRSISCTIIWNVLGDCCQYTCIHIASNFELLYLQQGLHYFQHFIHCICKCKCIHFNLEPKNNEVNFVLILHQWHNVKCNNAVHSMQIKWCYMHRKPKGISEIETHLVKVV